MLEKGNLFRERNGKGRLIEFLDFSKKFSQVLRVLHSKFLEEENHVDADFEVLHIERFLDKLIGL